MYEKKKAQNLQKMILSIEIFANVKRFSFCKTFFRVNE